MQGKLYRYLSIAVIVIIGAGCTTVKQPASSPAKTEPTAIPFYEVALGDFDRPVTTSSEMAQAYMNQGFQMMYAFASDEAPATFRIPTSSRLFSTPGRAATSLSAHPAAESRESISTANS